MTKWQIVQMIQEARARAKQGRDSEMTPEEHLIIRVFTDTHIGYVPEFFFKKENQGAFWEVTQGISGAVLYFNSPNQIWS